MAYIRVDVSHAVINGTNISFKAPCDCTAVDGLKAYFPNEAGTITNQVFLFTDAHGNNLAGLGHLFTKGAIVKAILNVDEGKAYLQNADTNAYLEGKFEAKADLVGGKVPAKQLPDMDYIPTKEKGAASGVATLGTDGKLPDSQKPYYKASDVGAIPATEKGASGGVATLGTDGKLVSSQKPVYTASDVGAAPMYLYSTTDLTAGSSSLETGKLYFVYE